ncbi:restriction endonuclease subunit S [Catenibacterium mitsuokai]|uniref:restriction endonuclease subunit S n=1 Tax=Catenibacterium mitsuokai TaxID=100886 RepID=UPI001FD49F0A|nr:restriction endonuclease subunit S [Catenibacterium mitsuokai]MBT9815356.1 restriction endonuclease subunit S [Catenibacterium mitsuokai]
MVEKSTNPDFMVKCKSAFVGGMRVKLKDITKISKGTQINGKNLIDDGAYSYLNGGINPSGKWNEFNVAENTVTISEGGNSSGYVNYMNEAFWCGAHCYYLYDGPKNSKYLYYALKSQQERLFRIRSGACMPNIKKSDLGNFIIEYEEDETRQEEVVKVLEKCELLIEDYNKKLALLDEAVRARFVEMFGDPVVNDKKWKIRYFSDLGELKRGKSKHRPRNDPILLGGKYPLIQTGDVTNSNTYIKSYTSAYSEEGLKQSKMWKKGTLCITIAANIAESAILTFDACFPDSVVGFTSNGEVISLFIHYWLSFLQPILEENAPAVAQKNLNVATLEKVGVIVPPLELQNQFASFVQEIDKSRLLNNHSLLLLKSITF